MLSSRIKFKELLEEDDQAVCNELNELLSSDNKEHKQMALNRLLKYHPRRLYILASMSEEIKKVCDGEEFNKRIIEEKFYPNCLPKEPVRSIHEGFNVTPFHQLMGYFLSQEAINLKGDSANLMLDEACKEGSYHALNKRIEFLLQHINKMSKHEIDMNPEAINFALDQIQADAAQLGDLYRAVGYYDAAFHLVTAAEYYSELDWVKLQLETKQESKSKDPEAIKKIKDILEKAMEYFYLSYFSSETKASKMINQAVRQGKDLLAGMEAHFKDWQGGKKFMIRVCSSIFHIKRAEGTFTLAATHAEEEAKKYPDEYSLKPI